jgi:hypothetical protein
MNFLSGYKTYIVAGCALVGSIGLFVDGKETLPQLVEAAGTFLSLIFMRAGIKAIGK